VIDGPTHLSAALNDKGDAVVAYSRSANRLRRAAGDTGPRTDARSR
jgi:hypothetical protein